MKSKISIFALSFSTVCMVSSCLGDDNDTDVVYYDDAAIAGLTLGTLKCPSDTDSIDVTGSKYPLQIDQYARTITNAPDSLPINTNLKNTKFSAISLINSTNGLVGIKSLTSDEILYFVKDTPYDFSQPREIIVFSDNAKANLTSNISFSQDIPGTRKYTVNIVAHQELVDDFKWHKLDIDNDIKNYKSVKAGICNNNLVVLGKTANGSELKALVNGTWKKVKTFSANANMTTDGNVVYIADGGKIYSSSDATNWQTVSADVKTILGICGNEMFAISSNNKVVVSYDKGATWTNDNMEDGVIPSSDFNFISTATTTNKDIKRAFIIGNTNNGAKAVVWSKIVEDDATRDQNWMYQAFSGSNFYYLPTLSNLSVIPYNKGNLLAIGGNYDKMYYSSDCGITWQEDERFVLPEGFSANGASMTVDADNIIWIVCTGTGQVWKGRLNELGWK